ncbi:MAG: hypothetical protein WC644_02735 [Ignavibacteria bacterium]
MHAIRADLFYDKNGFRAGVNNINGFRGYDETEMFVNIQDLVF